MISDFVWAQNQHVTKLSKSQSLAHPEWELQTVIIFEWNKKNIKLFAGANATKRSKAFTYALTILNEYNTNSLAFVLFYISETKKP